MEHLCANGALPGESKAWFLVHALHRHTDAHAALRKIITLWSVIKNISWGVF